MAGLGMFSGCDINETWSNDDLVVKSWPSGLDEWKSDRKPMLAERRRLTVGVGHTLSR